MADEKKSTLQTSINYHENNLPHQDHRHVRYLWQGEATFLLLPSSQSDDAVALMIESFVDFRFVIFPPGELSKWLSLLLLEMTQHVALATDYVAVQRSFTKSWSKKGVISSSRGMCAQIAKFSHTNKIETNLFLVCKQNIKFLITARCKSKNFD